MEDKWIKDIKDRLADFEMEAPEGLWDAINPEAAKPNAEARSAKGFAKYRAVAAAAAVAAIAGIGLIYFVGDDNNLSPNEYVAYKSAAGKSENTLNLAGISPTNPAKQSANLSQLNSNTLSHLKQKREHINAEEEITVMADSPVIVSEDEKPNADLTEETSQTESDKGKENRDAKLSLLDYGYDYMPTRNKSPRAKTASQYGSDKISIGVMTSAGSFGYDSNSGNPSFSNNGNPPSNGQDNPNFNDPNGGDIDGNDSNNPVIPDNAIPDDKTDEISHHMPVKFGLAFLYRLSHKIGIETGLTYTYLSSDVKYGGSNSKFTDGTQSLHYVGIPVNVKYRPIHTRWFDIYLSSGFAFDKCVSSSVNGRLRTPQPGMRATERMSLGEKPFQISANISAGVQFNITPSLGLYVEPGAGYYFNDGSHLSTYYKEHPLNFNINAGLRLSIGPGL